MFLVSFVLDWSNTEDKTALHIAAQEGKEGFVNVSASKLW